LELLDRLNLSIGELSQAIEQEVEKYPAGAALDDPSRGWVRSRHWPFVLIIGEALRFQCGK